MIRKVISYKLWVMGLIALLTYNSSLITHHYCFAQDNSALVNLSKQIIEAKTKEELYPLFEEVKDLYFQEDKYSQLVELLKSLSQQKEALGPFTDYYTALARYYQIKHLEEAQEWDEYFSQGNSYRDQLTAAAGKAIDSTNPKDALNIRSRLLLWQFHKDQQDAFVESSLADLMQAISGYAEDAKDLKPIREAADKLLAHGEKGKSKELYQTYANKLTGSVKEAQELEALALGFYKEGNLELSLRLYDVYIERIAQTYPKEKLIPILINIARNFSSQDEGKKDAYYAEKLFNKIEEAGTKDAFDEELMYLRAFNVEKIKEYSRAKDFYLDLLQRYPETKYADEAYFKAGIISTYVLRDIKTGRDYFEKLAHSASLSANPEPVEGLAQKEILSPQVISGLYQLGLLSQWENDLAKAKDYYNVLLEKAGNDFTETVALAQERLKEITGSKPIGYNLKIFLDLSLKEEEPAFTPGLADLNSSRYRLKKDENVDIKCTPYTVESGCMQVEIQYLWSGDLGTAKPPLERAEFNTTYVQRGTKEINLVVVSPSGVLDRTIELVDVY